MSRHRIEQVTTYSAPNRSNHARSEFPKSGPDAWSKSKYKMEFSMNYHPISQNNDDHFYTAVCAYVRGKPNNVVTGTVGEEQAEIAKRLLQDNPAILDDKDRLLAEIATIHYRESRMEADEAWWVE